MVGRQEHAVEREASWGITKLRVDGGRAINNDEVAVARGVDGSWDGLPEELELEHVLGVMSCLLST